MTTGKFARAAKTFNDNTMKYMKKEMLIMAQGLLFVISTEGRNLS